MLVKPLCAIMMTWRAAAGGRKQPTRAAEFAAKSQSIICGWLYVCVCAFEVPIHISITVNQRKSALAHMHKLNIYITQIQKTVCTKINLPTAPTNKSSVYFTIRVIRKTSLTKDVGLTGIIEQHCSSIPTQTQSLSQKE